MCSGFVNGCNNPGIVAVYIRRTSKAGPREQERIVEGNINTQLKVGPMHRGTSGVPATNGESWTSVILAHC